MQQIQNDDLMTDAVAEHEVLDGGYPLRWLALRWIVAVIAGWYITMPLLAFGMLAVIGMIFGARTVIIAIPLMILALAVGGAAAGTITWQTALIGRVRKRDWQWTSAIAIVLGFGLLALVLIVRPAPHTIESYDSGLRTVYTLNEGYGLTEVLAAFALVFGFMIPHGITLHKYARRAWLIWPMTFVVAGFWAMNRIGHDQWLAQSDGIEVFEFSPYMGSLLMLILLLPIISGLLLTVIGWRTPRKAKRDVM